MRVPLLADVASPVSLAERFIKTSLHQRLRLERESIRIPLLTTYTHGPLDRNATANVRCYDRLAKEVLMRVLGYLIVGCVADVVEKLGGVVSDLFNES